MKTFTELGTEIGELVERKAEAYGESFARCGDYLRILFPDGIRPEQYSLAMLLARDFDKSMRAVNDPDAFGESPFIDKAGYAILGAHLHQQRKASSSCNSVNGPDAPSSSAKSHSATAEPSIDLPPSLSAGAKIAPAPLPQPDGCSAPLTSASAPTATEAASQSAVDRLDQRRAQVLLELRDLFYPHQITLQIDCVHPFKPEVR
jgi:hypothetical protein